MQEITEDRVARIMAQPYYAINIHPGLCTPHEPLISKGVWIAAQVVAINEMGAQKYVETLLAALENPAA